MTGLYFLDGDAPKRARDLRPSGRGELEIVSLLETYLADGTLWVERIEAGLEWYDAGTHDSLLQASLAVQRLQQDGVLFGSPEEAAFRQGWSSLDSTASSLKELGKTAYGKMLERLASNPLRNAHKIAVSQ